MNPEKKKLIEFGLTRLESNYMDLNCLMPRHTPLPTNIRDAVYGFVRALVSVGCVPYPLSVGSVNILFLNQYVIGD